MSRGKKILSIIIVSFNVKDKILRCLRNLVPTILGWEIIVIDNNSSDRSFETLKKQFQNKIILKRNRKNFGFAKTVNQGIKLSQGKYILLVNPDTIPTSKVINQLLRFFDKHYDIGIIGGKLNRPHAKGDIYGTFVNKPSFWTGLFDFTNLRKLWSNNPFHRAFYYRDDRIVGPKDVWGVSGAFMLIRSEVIEKIGVFDENFFMYLEDVDFGIRAKEAGFRVVFYPHAAIIHESGSSSQNKFHINVPAWRESRKYFFRKHFGIIRGNILWLAFTIDEMVNNFIHWSKNEQ